MAVGCAIGPVTACITPVIGSICTELSPLAPPENEVEATEEIDELPGHQQLYWIPVMPVYDPLEKGNIVPTHLQAGETTT